MFRYLLQRLALALLVCLAVSLLTFFLLNSSGDVVSAIAGEEATPEQVAELRASLGLDRPWPVRYLAWITDAAQGDFGRSLFFRETVADLIMHRLPNTLTLASMSLLVMLSLSIPLGILAAFRPNTWLDRAALSLAVLGQAMPNFWFGLILIVIFALRLGIAPPSGSETIGHFILPAIALGYYATPPVMRLTRAGMIEVLESDYIRTAYAKGLSTRVVLFKHALRNAVIPVVALTAVQFGNMLGGSVVIETVFGIQGVGYLAWESISRLDVPVVQAILLIVAVFYIVLVLLSDFLNAWLDPRIRR
ncbi:ABC transporter permease [Roseitranquillus sediminis]|uniref:ABC transporter permease n=1 Tax=Roseitranquillus sediminis TaxID=2809051 RepID=UPI001D0CA92B|nr:ABC transporter permease [Roseitranquillus sediminis]MBM9595431.1 ABC transporter permease [Roseitranquillus sediminis]